MGLSPIMVDKIFEVVRDVYALGVTVVLVEQNASRALAIADRGYVMESGLITMTGPGQQLLNDPRCAQPTWANKPFQRIQKGRGANTASLFLS